MATKTKPATKRGPQRFTKANQYGWKDSYYVRIYELALSGASMRVIAKTIGVRSSIFGRWLRAKPALREAIERARRPACQTGRDESTPDHKGIGQRFIDLVYRRLPLKLQKIWQEIEDVTGGPMGDDIRKKPRDAGDRIDRLFVGNGAVRARQSIWVAALVASNFSVLEACRKVNISISSLNSWKEEPEFNEIFGIIEQCKKEFLDGKVWTAIDNGEPTILKWASECINADKGWVRPKSNNALGEGNTFNMTTIQLQQSDKDLDALPLEDKLKALEKLREQSLPALPPIDLVPNK